MMRQAIVMTDIGTSEDVPGLPWSAASFDRVMTPVSGIESPRFHEARSMISRSTVCSSTRPLSVACSKVIQPSLKPSNIRIRGVG
jgi:hypothetical protein